MRCATIRVVTRMFSPAEIDQYGMPKLTVVFVHKFASGCVSWKREIMPIAIQVVRNP